MIKIENLQTTLVLKFNSDNSPVYANYYELIKLCLNSTSTPGLTINNMRLYFKLVDKIETLKEDEMLTVTHGELNTLKESVLSFKWVQSHKDILDFGDYIESLK